MKDFFSKTPEEIRDLFHARLKPMRNSLVIIAESDHTTESLLHKYDLIFVFDQKQEMVVAVQRFNKKHVSWARWTLVRILARQFVKKFKHDTLQVSMTTHKDYIDLTFYKTWWAEWAESLLVS
jgi:hypothetical protein